MHLRAVALGASILAITACGGESSTALTSAPAAASSLAAVVKAASQETASPSGTTIPGTTQITDGSGNLWTVSGGVVHENGALAGYSNSVTLLVYEGNVVYQENAAGGWWSWNGSTWVSSSDPRDVPAGGACGTINGMAVKTTPVANLCTSGAASSVGGTGPWTWSCAGSNGGAAASCSASLAQNAAASSPEGTTIPSATQVFDSAGNLWTVSGGVVYRNGAPAGYSKNVELLLYDNNVIYHENTISHWYAWTGHQWVASSDPRSQRVTGTCGSINGMPVNTKPVANLCSTGTATPVSGTGPWTWSCNGSNGGTSASCSASLATPTGVASPEGTTIPSATQIIDSGGNRWTVSKGVVYQNGALAGSSWNVVLLLYDNNIVYQENSSGHWWSWNGVKWAYSSDPEKGSGGGGGAPTISGTPSTSDAAGHAYSFVPATTDTGGGTLSFSIKNMPVWASFNKGTGALTGTPSSAQVGVYSDIVISVSNGSASASLPAYSITVTSGSTSPPGPVTLSWTPPTDNTNGTPLTDLAGYTIFYGNTPGSLTHTIQVANANANSYEFTDLAAGTYYFTIAAYTTTGIQGVQAPVGSTTIR